MGTEHHFRGFATDELRCFGLGGVPVPAPTPRDVLPLPAVWQVTGNYDPDGESWGRVGFAVLDLAGGRIDMSYRDDARTEKHRETIE